MQWLDRVRVLLLPLRAFRLRRGSAWPRGGVHGSTACQMVWQYGELKALFAAQGCGRCRLCSPQRPMSLREHERDYYGRVLTKEERRDTYEWARARRVLDSDHEKWDDKWWLDIEEYGDANFEARKAAGLAAHAAALADGLSREAACDAALAAVEALLLKQEPWRLEFLKAEEGVGEADANNRRRRAAKGRAKEEREERAELAPFGEDYGSGGLNRAEIDLFDDDGP